MSVVFCEGFETSADQPDVYARGLLSSTNPVTVSGMGVLPLPSRSGAAGTGLMLRGPYSAATTLPCVAAATPDYGLLSLNQSVNALWNAGGFSLGFSASFNSLNTLQVASTYPRQLAYDGAQYYWAITYNGSAYGVAYSTDLKNWTPVTAPGFVGVNSSIQIVGSGSSATLIVSSSACSVTELSYYSTNFGSTWTAFAQAVTNSNFAYAYTGNATTPYISVSYNAGWKVFPFTSLASAAGAALTSPMLVTGVAYGNSMIKLVNGVIIIMGTNTPSNPTYPTTGTSYFSSCLSANNPATPANWSAITSCPGQMADVTFFNNKWFVSGYGGIYSSPQLGTPSAVQGPAGPWTQVFSTTTNIASSIATNGSVIIAVGQDVNSPYIGALYTSTDGVTWTKSNRFQLNSANITNGAWIPVVMWDGSRFVMTGGLSNNWIATSPDAINWSVVYATDYPETAGTATLSFPGVYSGTQNPATGIFTPWGTAAGNVAAVGFTSGAAASSARTVTAATVTAGASANSALSTSLSAVGATIGQQPPSTLTHYYELVFTPVPGQPNMFAVQAVVDNNVLGYMGNYQFAAPTDTGLSQLFFNLPRNGNFTVIDDIYLTNAQGTYHNSRLGTQHIYPAVASSDVQDQLTASSGANNAAVAGALSNSEGYVYATSGVVQDIYGITSSAPSSGASVNAVQVEGFLSSYGTGTSSKGQVGLQSNGHQAVGNIVTTNNSPTRAIALVELDPNTGLPWTLAAAAALDLVVGKTS
jgi:hypothetical protein